MIMRALVFSARIVLLGDDMIFIHGMDKGFLAVTASEGYFMITCLLEII